MSVEHAMSCSFGNFPSIQHNELQDITAAFFSEVCHGPENFWGQDKRLAYFDIKNLTPLLPPVPLSQWLTTISLDKM